MGQPLSLDLRVRLGLPHGHRKTTALVAGLRVTVIVAPMSTLAEPICPISVSFEPFRVTLERGSADIGASRAGPRNRFIDKPF